jgi:WD40 repeat protein
MLQRTCGQATLLVAFGALAILTDDARSQKKDAELPDGAVARMGSLRWRHAEPITFVGMPTDGKTIITAAQDNTIRLWDRETGKELRRFDAPPPVQPNPRVAATPIAFASRAGARVSMSEDGKLLAAILPNQLIQVWSVETGKPLCQIASPRTSVATILLSPDGKMLAARGADRITYLYDAATGKELRQIKPAQATVVRAIIAGQAPSEANGLVFSPDGKTIAIAEVELIMQKINVFVRICATDSGNEIRQIEMPQGGVSAIAYSRDAKLLIHGSGNAILVRAADTGKEIRKIESQSTSHALLFAPDGKTFAARGNDRIIRVFDTESGKKLHDIGEAPAGANLVVARPFFLYALADTRDFAYSQDSKVLSVGGVQALRFFDVGTGKELPVPGGHRGAISAVVVTPDGKTMVSRGRDQTIRRWNAHTGEELSVFAEPAGTINAAFSTDGATIAFANSDGTIRLHSCENGKELHKLRTGARDCTCIVWSLDGKRLAMRGSENVVRVLDIAKGGEIKQIKIELPNNPNVPGGRGVAASGSALAFAPDGQSIAAYVASTPIMIRGEAPANAGNTLRIWDITTGKEIRQIQTSPERAINCIAFSPDGRVIAAENTNQTVSLWEIASGRERALLGQPSGTQPAPGVIVVGGGALLPQPAPTGAGQTLAYALDGSLIVSRGPNNLVRVWEVDTVTEVGAFKGHVGGIATLGITADGKRAFSGSTDTTILVWDLARLRREPRTLVELQPMELDALWTDLAGNNAVKARDGIIAFAWAPKKAVPFLRDRVKPAPPADVKKIDQWIADLDSASFPKRSKAIEELEKLGELAIPALKKTLASTVALETRRRIEPLLEKLTTGNLSVEQVRTVRAIEALEKMGTAEARELLETLSQGAAGALTTRHAQAAIDRMGKQSARN